ncbi:MAG: bifunctional hydroxymethylpyrimidine kinase/phosphomethylpyrimidine kinase [Neomegalonema sp.]|nr:bifunctional hydroxymethylpyrimidine kinase/phosphomethylpyrimidine kinase [Neomegalonema sp.]
MTPNILSIAGSDPSGGAGIQADLKTIAANGGYGMAAITALTAQNTQGVTGVELIAPSFVAQQIETVLDDVAVHAVKIGMIATADIAKAVADVLRRRRPRWVVLDPVMVAKSGHSLLAPDAVRALVTELAPLATVVTPNLPEAVAMLNVAPVLRRDEMPAIGDALRALGPAAALVKGGHLEGADSPDYLAQETDGEWLEGARVATKNTHGTGCTLSSAIATQLARTDDVALACRNAKAYVTRAIETADALSVGSGHGPLNHFNF